MKTGFSILGVALVAIIAVTFMSRQNEQTVSEQSESAPTTEAVVQNIEAAPAGISEAGRYEVYAQEKFAYAQKDTLVLFFHATWCPSCRALNTDIEEHLQEIPANVSILKTDYDSEIKLKQKYGITTQHSFAQVDADGNLIKRWSGSLTLEDLIAEIR